ncbi:NAD(P)H-dependent oxidoreductase [Alkalicaulis satelles]|uniref:NAD(P)H-dependent oxidoreductase n=1 Tax=Alkalicaulis satelles TaxID=2609175 RepID=A0A5M6ZLU4_9PROT|nr:NAD(P)H-dependent oxidoreductase [Alkalicaulis satelles]KAA5804895.1 NAD(P)H-dependent oxidoreductase [Alkalicaulis satelles]
MSRICLINAHPDPAPQRFCHALADAYQQGAEGAGHEVSRFDAGALDYGFLTSAAAFSEPAPEPLQPVQAALQAADHVVLIYPLWLGMLPARAKALLEHLGRANMFLDTGADSSRWPAQKMRGKSARVIVTMGMPAAAYRIFFRSHSLKALETGVLGMSGFKPVRSTVFGMVEGSAERRTRMLADARRLGEQAR